MKRVRLKRIDVLEYVRDSSKARGYPPTLREISAHFGWSSTTSTVDHLRQLEKRGFISRVPGRERTLVVTSAGARELSKWPKRRAATFGRETPAEELELCRVAP